MGAKYRISEQYEYGHGKSPDFRWMKSLFLKVQHLNNCQLFAGFAEKGCIDFLGRDSYRRNKIINLSQAKTYRKKIKFQPLLIRKSFDGINIRTSLERPNFIDKT